MTTNILRFLPAVLLLALIPACKTYNPAPIAKANFYQRTQTKTDGGLTVYRSSAVTRRKRTDIRTTFGKEGSPTGLAKN